MYLQVNKFNPMGEVIGTGMGEFFRGTSIINVFFIWWCWGQIKMLNVYPQVWQSWSGTGTSHWWTIITNRRKPPPQLTVWEARGVGSAPAETGEDLLWMQSSRRNLLLCKNQGPKPRLRLGVQNKNRLRWGRSELCLCSFVYCSSCL